MRCWFESSPVYFFYCEESELSDNSDFPDNSDSSDYSCSIDISITPPKGGWWEKASFSLNKPA